MTLKIPAPHLVLRNFLSPEDHADLLDWTLKHEGQFSAAAVGGTGVDLSARRCQKLWDLGPSEEILRARVDAAYTEWLKELKVTPFTLDRLEVQIVAYGNDAHFSFHIDAAIGEDRPASNRRLTAVYYFHTEPCQFTGGHLRLYDLGALEGSDAFVSIPPEQNMLLIFPSWVGHEVTRVDCPNPEFAASRFAVNCWLHQPAKSS